jgi:protein TonB
LTRSRLRAAALGPLLAAALALPAPGEPDVSARPPFEDLAPQGPALEARLAQIALRVQQALVYPELARRDGIQGEAKLTFVIDARGRPREVELVESSGSQSLDWAARRALERAGALPYVAGRVTVPVRFALACEE